MPLPRWLARFNLRITNHLLGPLAKHMPGMGLVIHTGRKTGQRHSTPIMYFQHGNQLIFALTYGRESQWVKNVVAQGGCYLLTRGRLLKLGDPRMFHDRNRRFVPRLHRFVLSLLSVSDFLEMKTE